MKPQHATLLFNAAGGLIGLIVLGYAVNSFVSPEPVAACGAGYDAVAQFGYESASGKPLSSIDMQARLGGREWGVYENTHAVKASARSETTVLEVRLPKGSINPNNPDAPLGGTGFRWRPKGLEGAAAACLKYSIYLPADFEFQKGGKLPGLFGGVGPAGGTRADGKNGFSTRYMWRAEGKGEVYAYVPGHPNGRGSSLDRGAFELKRGAWNTLMQEVVLNTPGRSDGILKVWHDGRVVITRTNMRYRDVEGLTVSGVMADIFYGGADPSYAAPKDTTIKLSPIEVRWKK